jgi:2-methylcitrate dehydratase PrpD
MEAEMAAEATQALAQFVTALRYEAIPQRVRDHCKDLLLDALACAVSGRLGEETGQVAAFASALAQSSEASVIGGEPMSLAGATLLNAYQVTATTMCDVHRETMTHVTPEVISPALAIAERDGLDGRALLTAIAAGCEVKRGSASAPIIRNSVREAGTAPAFSVRSAPRRRSDRY